MKRAHGVRNKIGEGVPVPVPAAAPAPAGAAAPGPVVPAAAPAPAGAAAPVGVLMPGVNPEASHNSNNSMDIASHNSNNSMDIASHNSNNSMDILPVTQGAVNSAPAPAFASANAGGLAPGMADLIRYKIKRSKGKGYGDYEPVAGKGQLLPAVIVDSIKKPITADNWAEGLPWWLINLIWKVGKVEGVEPWKSLGESMINSNVNNMEVLNSERIACRMILWDRIAKKLREESGLRAWEAGELDESEGVSKYEENLGKCVEEATDIDIGRVRAEVVAEWYAGFRGPVGREIGPWMSAYYNGRGVDFEALWKAVPYAISNVITSRGAGVLGAPAVAPAAAGPAAVGADAEWAMTASVSEREVQEVAPAAPAVGADAEGAMTASVSEREVQEVAPAVGADAEGAMTASVSEREVQEVAPAAPAVGADAEGAMTASVFEWEVQESILRMIEMFIC